MVGWMKTMPTQTRPFDPSAYFESEEAIAAYLPDALDADDPGLIAAALGVVARAGHDAGCP